MKTDALHSLFLQSKGVTTDTRKIENNTLFFALKGDNFNGNNFAGEALKKGASFAIIDEPQNEMNERFILVPDVLTCLQELAGFHRNQLSIPIIALTGSNGKTTTKELINSVLSKKYKTTATIGNLNNHIGVPLTLLSMNTDTEIGIVEMGANHLKEIATLCKIANPDYGCITNFGKAHLEGFGSVEGVIKGKSELYDYLKKHNKHIFYNREDSIQHEKLKDYPNKSAFGSDESNFICTKFEKANPFVQLQIGITSVSSKLIGSYNYTNICYAALIGRHFDVEATEIKDAIENYTPANNRSQIIEKDAYNIILDAYNANPSSMTAALQNFSQLEDKNKLAILGDMFELGPEAASEHQLLSELAQKLGLTNVFLVGENFYNCDSSYQKFEKYSDLEYHIATHKPQPGTILIKGSRGMALERILNVL